MRTASELKPGPRLGVDLGGTSFLAVVCGPDGAVRAEVQQRATIAGALDAQTAGVTGSRPGEVGITTRPTRSWTGSPRRRWTRSPTRE